MSRLKNDHTVDNMAPLIQSSRAGHSASTAEPSGPTSIRRLSYLRKHKLNSQISVLDSEIEEYDRDIKKLQDLRATHVTEKNVLLKELQQVQTRVVCGKGKGSASHVGIDYTIDGFDWSEELKVRMKKVFGINSFRLCQQGVCNANMDGRDIVCVMPTGGGKSLTYQLPALLTPGCTLVVSPLISLITDQILHLRDAGVEAVMLTGGTSKEESREINADIIALAGKKGGSPARDIKLCYVTPEKIAKSKAFMSLLEKLACAGKLARIVIDEAHCVSQLGHDFRPDYGKLSILRQLFPHVPIMALSATCPPKVLQDLITTLRLKGVVDGTCANTDGTVYFSAPLYRKNLHYSVLPKPSSANSAIKNMADYILKHHPNATGIVYCLSKKDAENVASGLNMTTDGIIKTGVYHADIRDHEKEKLHKQWRKGAVKVVCATIAFGLGIDKGDVRFVLHHSLSTVFTKNLDARDVMGRTRIAFCITAPKMRPASAQLYAQNLRGNRNVGALVVYGFYAPVVTDDRPLTVHDMLRFAQEMQECRKVHFAKYFSASSHLSVAAWTTEDSEALAPCGHCDNCTRPPESMEHKDVTVEAWQIVNIVDSIHRSEGRLTLTMMGDLARGVSNGPFEIINGGGKKDKVRAGDKIDVDLDAIAGGKVCLNKEDLEMLLVELIVSQYLNESFHTNAYAINVYIVPGPRAPRLIRLSREDVSSGGGRRVMCSFRRKGSGKAKATKSSKKDSERSADKSKQPRSPQKKRKRGIPEEEGDGDDFVFLDEDGGSERGLVMQGRRVEGQKFAAFEDDDENEGESDDWAHSFRSSCLSPRPKKHWKHEVSRGESSKAVLGDVEVMVLSD